MGRFAAFKPAGPMAAAPFGWSWQSLMRMALLEARKSADLGEVPVGAVLIHLSGRIVASCGNRMLALRDPTAHAEVLALRQGGSQVGVNGLADCLLVATLEPCLMCVGALAHARIAGVVFGAADLAAGAVISRADHVSLPVMFHKTWYMGGILADDCARLLVDFFADLRRRKGPDFSSRGQIS